jgi:hypothetical protein
MLCPHFHSTIYFIQVLLPNFLSQERLTVGRNIRLGSAKIIQGQVTDSLDSCVEAGSNTSTTSIRVVGGDDKGSLESEAVKYDREPHETRTRE